MSRYLYWEGASGISGDMAVAALLDLGASREKMETALASLHLEEEFHCHVSRKTSYSIAGCDFDVHLHHRETLCEQAYTEEAHYHEHECGHGHHHHHDDPHHPHHPHVHRHLADVETILERAQATPSALALAKRIFRIVAEAEAQAHGVPVEQVHFHEVGAVDSIVDILTTAVLVDDLAPEGCIVCGLSEGQGVVMCQHGELPVPVPAVLNIATTHGIPLRPTATSGEMVTPTGIAIAAALRTRSSLPPSFRILRTGIGLGKRDFGKANFLRVWLLEDEAPAETSDDGVEVLECNIDDSTPECLGHAMETLLAAGALEVFFTPCHMKKNRPGVVLTVLAPPARSEELLHLLFLHTSTIGVRRNCVQRACLQRTACTLELPGGNVRAKCVEGYGIRRVYPEYESVRLYAETTGMGFPDAYAAALAACRPPRP